MARSLKKGPYVHYKLEKKVAANVEANKKNGHQNLVKSQYDYS
jgi:ribosomal protein S19